MPQKITEREINHLVEDFKSGVLINNLVKSYGYTKPTIIKYLKKNINDEEYKRLIINSRSKNKIPRNSTIDQGQQLIDYQANFIEIKPLNCEINDELQKDLSSVPLSSINFPKVVYLIVDKNIELRIKLLREYIAWQFLPDEDLNRQTIEIYSDIKDAKKNCMKEQKVIKVPNTSVFKIVAPILISRGISRIISEEQLICL